MKDKITLLIDADDTLWHNNIYYEQAITDFMEIMRTTGLDKAAVEKEFRTREIDNVKHHGYGSVCFTISMLEIYRETCIKHGKEINGDIVRKIEINGKQTCDYDIVLLPGVKETLPVLTENFVLVIVTKGCQNEQMAKIKRSGISQYFHDITVVSEKTAEVYRSIIKKYNLDTDKTWMIGNSTRSDINPAKSVGLRTVYIPYHATWEFENETINEHGHETIILEDFGEISNYLSKEYTLNPVEG
jgi:putative hydrolase of the HAD superfamily